MDAHIKILGIIFIAFSALQFIGGVLVFFAMSFLGIALMEDAGIFSILFPCCGVFMIVLSAPGVFVGLGLLAYKPWARIIAIVFSALWLLNFPFGTALGIYALWVLLNNETETYFR